MPHRELAHREMDIEFASDVEHLAMIRENIRLFMAAQHLSGTAADDVELAVDEAVTNVVQHAYGNHRDGLIRVRAWKEKRNLVIAIRDFGKGYKPQRVSLNDVRRIILGRTSQGLGRYLMKKCMDSVRYKSVPGKYNETVMVKKTGRN
jgi:serine/threonine-protein kinase RsbW